MAAFRGRIAVVHLQQRGVQRQVIGLLTLDASAEIAEQIGDLGEAGSVSQLVLGRRVEAEGEVGASVGKPTFVQREGRSSSGVSRPRSR